MKRQFQFLLHLLAENIGMLVFSLRTMYMIYRLFYFLQNVLLFSLRTISGAAPPCCLSSAFSGADLRRQLFYEVDFADQIFYRFYLTISGP